MTDYDFSNSVKFAASSMGDISPDTYVYRSVISCPGSPTGHFTAARPSYYSGYPG